MSIVNDTNPQDLLMDIARYIDEASARVADGHYVSLAGLDDAVQTLCERVQSLSPDDGKRYADQLQMLHDQLGQLQAEMEGARHELKGEIDEVNNRQKAAKAYRKETK